MDTVKEQRGKDILTFFEKLFDTKKGKIRTAVGNKEMGFFKETWWCWPQDKEAVRIYYSTVDPNMNYYFCPTLFSKAKALKENALPTNILWSDLDDAGPISFPTDFPQPTFVLETSPNRYQGLWQLTKDVDAETAESFSKGIAYAVDADKSGWDVGQLLRIPGTVNKKYDVAPVVTCIYDGTRVFDPNSFVTYALSRTYSPDYGDLADVIEQAQSFDPQDIITIYSLDSEPYLEELIHGTGDSTDDDRSSRLWALETALTEHGLNVPEVMAVASISPYNKYSGEGREWLMLAKEAMKAERIYMDQQEATVEYDEEDEDDNEQDEDTSSTTTKKTRREPKLVPITAKELSEKEFEPLSWIVEGILPEDEPLIISATYQSRKTFIALELAVALSTGCPFLGYFKTHATGNVLYIQEEMTERQINERMQMICKARAVEFPTNFFFINQRGFLLDLKEDRQELERFIQKHNIKYVFFDPLGKQLSRSDINSSNDVSNITRWLVSLSNKYGVIDVMVHHMNKQVPGKRLTDSISGSWAIPGHYGAKFCGGRLDKYGNVVQFQRATRTMGEAPDVIMKFHHDRINNGYYVEVQENLGPEDEQKANEVANLLLKREKIPVLEISEKLGYSPTDILRYGYELMRQNRCLVLNENVKDVETGKVETVTFITRPVATPESIAWELDHLDDGNESQ